MAVLSQRRGVLGASVQSFLLLLLNIQVLGWLVFKGVYHGPIGAEHDHRQGHAGSSPGARSASIGFSADYINPSDAADFDIAVWAKGPPPLNEDMIAVRTKLKPEEREELRALCGRILYHGLENIVVSHTSHWTFFATGDLPLMWIRDSAFQIGVLLPRIQKRPALRRVVEGGIRAQAFYILQDPYANGFYPEWRPPAEHNNMDRMLGRGGWVGVRNYELDSGAYYLNLLWNYYKTPGIYRPDLVLGDTMIFDAAFTMVKLWITEQTHNESSPYRFYEMSNKGLGGAVNYTGMVWSAFRPSDDANKFGYNIPANMLTAGGLKRALELNRIIWKSAEFEAAASKLLADIEEGLEKYGTIKTADNAKVYAYEIDGLGHELADFDDPNWPSLISVPLLGYDKYDPKIYATTRKRLMDAEKNKYWFKGKKFAGMGSPHTDSGMAWALHTLAQALTANTTNEKVEALRLLIKLQCGDGLMHESIDVNNIKRCTRRWFEWANALGTVVIEQLMGEDCDAAAEETFRARLKQREMGNGQDPSQGNDIDSSMYTPLYHPPLEAQVQWDVKYEEKVEAWKGIGWTI